MIGVVMQVNFSRSRHKLSAVQDGDRQIWADIRCEVMGWRYETSVIRRCPDLEMSWHTRRHTFSFVLPSFQVMGAGSTLPTGYLQCAVAPACFA
jgi:hypothetical protein